MRVESEGRSELRTIHVSLSSLVSGVSLTCWCLDVVLNVLMMGEGDDSFDVIEVGDDEELSGRGSELISS